MSTATKNGASKNGNKKHAGLPSLMRRVVPGGYAQATLILNGTSPLLMASSDTDPEGDLYRAYRLLGAKRGKTIEDEAKLSELEWKLRLYLDDEIGPYIPGANLRELLRESATKWKKGEEIKRSLVVRDYRVPLLYDGPRDQDGLWHDGFRHYAMVSNGGASRGRVRRCRPKFEDWAVAAEIAYDPDDLDFDFLGVVVERAMKYGLGDGRAIGFGSFIGSLERGELLRATTNGSALKQRDREQVLAHLALVDRITAVAA